jgi:hypothetical protein
MKLVPSPRFEKSLRRYDGKMRERVRSKLELFLKDKAHPSLTFTCGTSAGMRSCPSCQRALSPARLGGCARPDRRFGLAG